MTIRLSSCLLLLASVTAGCRCSYLRSPPKAESIDAPSDAVLCVPVCPSLARAMTGLQFDTSSCSQSIVADAGGRRIQRNTCFANNSRVEERTPEIGVYEVRLFANRTSLPAIITTLTAAGVSSTFDGTTNVRVLRLSLSDPTHLTLECDGHTVVMTPSKLQLCLKGATFPSKLLSKCEPGICP
jgi:hypothetical protein